LHRRVVDAPGTLVAGDARMASDSTLSHESVTVIPHPTFSQKERLSPNGHATLKIKEICSGRIFGNKPKRGHLLVALSPRAHVSILPPSSSICTIFRQAMRICAEASCPAELLLLPPQETRWQKGVWHPSNTEQHCRSSTLVSYVGLK
jgi:hypothetical protein